jgi:hypothetical protein
LAYLRLLQERQPIYCESDRGTPDRPAAGARRSGSGTSIHGPNWTAWMGRLREAAYQVRQAFKSQPKPCSLDDFSTSLVGRFSNERINRSRRLRARANHYPRFSPTSRRSARFAWHQPYCHAGEPRSLYREAETVYQGAPYAQSLATTSARA